MWLCLFHGFFTTLAVSKNKIGRELTSFFSVISGVFALFSLSIFNLLSPMIPFQQSFGYFVLALLGILIFILVNQVKAELIQENVYENGLGLRRRHHLIHQISGVGETSL